MSATRPFAIVTGASTGIGFNWPNAAPRRGTTYSHMLGGCSGGQAEYLGVPLRRCRTHQSAAGPQQ